MTRTTWIIPIKISGGPGRAPNRSFQRRRVRPRRSARSLPELAGRLNGLALRVPTPNVSVVDLVADLSVPVLVEEVNEAFKQAGKTHMRGILQYCEEPLVSSDFNGNDHSAIVDALSTMVTGERQVKILAWYDNEWGYACRVVDLVELVDRMEGVEPAKQEVAL